MPYRMYAHNGSSWILLDPTVVGEELWAHDGTAWREIKTGYVHTGSGWVKFWDVVIAPVIDSSGASADGDGDLDDLTDECACECSSTKKSRCICIHWNVSGCLAEHHIHIQESVNGSTWTTEIDNRNCANSPFGNWCQGTDDGGYEMKCSEYTNRYARVRIHDDTTHTIRATGSTHGPFAAIGCVA
jgi:hypothetical protein